MSDCSHEHGFTIHAERGKPIAKRCDDCGDVLHPPTKAVVVPKGSEVWAALALANNLGQAAKTAIAGKVREKAFLDLARALYRRARADDVEPVKPHAGPPTVARGAWKVLLERVGGRGAFAARLHVDPRTIHRWVTGARDPSGPTILAIRAVADSLGVRSPV